MLIIKMNINIILCILKISQFLIAILNFFENRVDFILLSKYKLIDQNILSINLYSSKYADYQNEYKNYFMYIKNFTVFISIR